MKPTIKQNFQDETPFLFPDDKATYMVGSYGPKAVEQEYVTPAKTAPKGFIARGRYEVKSKFG